MPRFVLLAASLLVMIAAPAAAQVTVYDSIAAGPLAGYGEPNANNPTFGDALNLSQGGTLNDISFTLFNSSTGGNTGSIQTGTMTINVYDNTTPYSGGTINNPLIGTKAITLDFSSSGGLGTGFFTTATADFSSLNLTVPQNVLVTQHFTETAGTSTANGIVLTNNSAVGSSPNNVYISSSATPSGSYSFGGGAANSQFGYTVHVTPVPEPGSLALAGLAAAGLGWYRRRAR